MVIPFVASCPLKAWHLNPWNQCILAVVLCGLQLMKAHLLEASDRRLRSIMGLLQAWHLNPKKTPATSVFGSSVPWSWWKHTSLESSDHPLRSFMSPCKHYIFNPLRTPWNKCGWQLRGLELTKAHFLEAADHPLRSITCPSQAWYLNLKPMCLAVVRLGAIWHLQSFLGQAYSPPKPHNHAT